MFIHMCMYLLFNEQTHIYQLLGTLVYQLLCVRYTFKPFINDCSLYLHNSKTAIVFLISTLKEETEVWVG